ncbi:MAG: response regulator [Candidatus Anammoxibacter sp.]
MLDDDKEILGVLRTHCELMGYELTICDDPIKALEMIKIEKFHIVLLDINMPKMTGIEMLKKIKETRPNIQVIMITAFTTAEKAIDCWENGASDYILKPFADLEQIGTIVNLTSERIGRWEEIYKQSM